MSVIQTKFQSPEVRVVEASAGSGKTYTLAKRYIQLILNPALPLEQIPLRNILAITFTNKASIEMKARILEFLKKIALKKLSSSEEEELLLSMGTDLDKASVKAFAIMEDLIRHYNFFQVQTIDKFINALLSGCAFKIGLTANFRIKTNTQEYLEHSLDELIDKASGDKRILKIFNDFLHHYLYLENRSGWFPKKDMLLIISDLFKQYNYYGCLFAESPFHSEDLIKKKKKILEEFKKLKENLPEKTEKRFVQSLDEFLKKHTQGFDVDSLSDYFNREEFPLRKGGELPRSVEKQWQNIRHDLKELVLEESHSLFNPYISIFHFVREEFLRLCAKDDCLFLEELNKKAGLLFEEDYMTVEELYYRLATRFHHYLVDEFQDTSRLQWLNLEKMVEEALSTGGTLFYVGDRKQAIYSFRGGDVELFDEIKERFQAFNVQKDFLTKNWRSQKAIVEFNNAIFSWENLSRFIQVKENFEIEKNKRKVCVKFTPEDLEEIKQAFQTAQQSFRPENSQGYVKIEYIDGDKKENRGEIIREKVVSLIQELKSRFALKDIAILARSNSEIEELTTWLLEEGILVESERTSNVKENPLVKELILFLKFLHSPIDNLAFSQFIVGDIFTRASGLKKEDMHQFLFSLRERLHQEKDFYTYTEFRRVYPEIWNQSIDEFFRNVGLYPLYELVVSIYHRFTILPNFSSSQGFLMHFLELIKSQEEDHAEIGSFLDYFESLEGEKLYVPVTESDAIKILTIHKSKGLEFPVVILPFLGMEIQVGSQSPDHPQAYILNREGDAMRLLRLKTKYLGFSEELYALYAKEYKKTFLSELNTTYVALTRPQRELYAFIPKKIKNASNLIQFLIPEQEFERGEKRTYDHLKGKKEAEKENQISTRSARALSPCGPPLAGSHRNSCPTDDGAGLSGPAGGGIGISEEKFRCENILAIPPAAYYDWINYLKEEFLDYEALRNRPSRLQGQILHFILSCIKNLKDHPVEDYLQKAEKEIGFVFPQISALDDYLRQIKQLVRKKELKPFFYIDEGEVFTEQEIINKQGHTKRLDRLIVKKDEIWIVDYKAALDPQGAYEEQVQEYMNLITELHPRHEVKGFLVYLDDLGIQEISMKAIHV